jgi:hypothetical protein
MVKIKNAFASGKDAWVSTLKSNAQSKGVIGKTSQNKSNAIRKDNKRKK